MANKESQLHTGGLCEIFVHFSFGFLVYVLRKRSSDCRLDPPCKIGWLSFSQFPSGSSAVLPKNPIVGGSF